MRFLILSLLLAGSATSPLLAQDRDVEEARAEPEQRAERVRPERDEARQDARMERMERADIGFGAGNREDRRIERREQVPVIGDSAMTTAAPADVDRGRRFDRPFDGRTGGGSRRLSREWAGENVDNRNNREGDSALPPSPSIAAPVRVGSTGHRDGHRWDGRWRDDRRYDWRSHRHHHRSLFRFGSYYDPYGYGYRRFSIGFNLFPNYYRSSYWLNDPWQYRLPPAYGPYRWVRYWDDALLVNIYTGQVVDVERNFFW